MARTFIIAMFSFFLVCGGVIADDSRYASEVSYNETRDKSTEVLIAKDSPSKKSLSADYEGTLRVYIVEPISRWRDYNYTSYNYGFLGFAIFDTISMPYQSSLTDTIVWNGALRGYGDIFYANIKVVAAVFNDSGVFKNSDPQTGYGPFNAFYADAVTGAYPGQTGTDGPSGSYSHSVLVEEGTATT
ncbi:MAG: hypothetical protein V3V99_10910 [candidate division Zixibacteria bacterium]